MTNEKITVHIDDEDILELIPDYLDARRDELEVLRHALEQNDFETLRGLGHKMKGSGGGYGLDRISEIGAQLETFAKAGDRDAVEQEINAMNDFLDRVEVVSP